MKYGAVFPQTEIGDDPRVVRDFIIAVEEMGFDFLLAYDHVIGANPEREGGWHGPYTHETPFHEVFTLFAYGAAITTHLEFVTGVLILPQRQTALVAKQAAQVDILSGGRFRLGIGVGWNQVEMAGLGEDFRTRGKRSAEQAEVLRALWTNDLVTYSGAYHELDDVGINPLPVQRPIPIWFGGGADAVLRRMARLGDGWMPAGMTPERARPQLETLHGYLQQEGRDIASFGVDVRLSLKHHPKATWGAFIDGWRELGMTHLSLVTMGMGYTSADEHLAALREFKAFVDQSVNPANKRHIAALAVQ